MNINLQTNNSQAHTLGGAPRSGEGSQFGEVLVSVTKNSSDPLKTSTWRAPYCHPHTGEEIFFEAPKKVQSDYRADRWAFKSVVNKILPTSRTSKCMRFRGFTDDGLSLIKIMKNKENKAFYSGLMACGSVWNCPICAAKISEKRRIELKSALDVAKDFGLKAFLVTLTVPHGIGDDLRDLRLRIRKAQGKLSSGRSSIKSQLKNINPSHDQVGFIRVLEVTHGQKNGFHPHLHILVFTSESVTVNILDKLYTESWLNACVSSGLPMPTRKHGCHVQDGEEASDYISKWGLEDEMTKSNSKVSRSVKGVTPFGLLKCILDGDDEFYTPQKATSLFAVYSKCFKGARQLHWSVGLRKLLSLDEEISDQELVDTKDDEAFTMGVLSFEQWKVIRKKKLESSILTFVESSSLEDLKNFIFNCTGLILMSHKNELDAHRIVSPFPEDPNYYNRYLE